MRKYEVEILDRVRRVNDDDRIGLGDMKMKRKITR